MNESDSSVSSLQSPSHEDIARRAQELWAHYGQPLGRDEEIWLEAERSLTASGPATATPPAPDTPPVDVRPLRRSNAIASPKMPPASRPPKGGR